MIDDDVWNVDVEINLIGFGLGKELFRGRIIEDKYGIPNLLKFIIPNSNDCINKILLWNNEPLFLRK